MICLDDHTGHLRSPGDDGLLTSSTGRRHTLKAVDAVARRRGATPEYASKAWSCSRNWGESPLELLADRRRASGLFQGCRHVVSTEVACEALSLLRSASQHDFVGACAPVCSSLILRIGRSSAASDAATAEQLQGTDR